MARWHLGGIGSPSTGRRHDKGAPVSGGWEPDERDVLKVLTVLAGESHVYHMRLREARAIVERLSTDLDDVKVDMLFASVTTAQAEPPRLGSPRHIEQLAVAVLKELRELRHRGGSGPDNGTPAG